MRIAIFEMEHFEVAYPLIRLFDTADNRITIFTSQECFYQLEQILAKDIHRFEVVIRKEASKYAFIYNAYCKITAQKTDLLFLSTVADNFLFYYLMVRELKSIRVVLTLHDINTFFQHKYAISLRRIIRITGKKLLMHQVQEFNVIAMPLIATLRKKIPSQKQIHCVPGAVYEPARFENVAHETNTVFTVVVPGSIDAKRRDYELVFQVLEEIKKRSLPMQIVLLGAAQEADGTAILMRAASLAESGYPLIFYREAIVDQIIYDQVLANASLVFIPSVINTVMSDDIGEAYGSTKSSGTLFDVVRHARPFIIPKLLQIDEFMEAAASRYDTVEEIIGFLESCMSNTIYLQALEMKAREASGHYTVEKIRARNPSLFNAPPA